MQRKICPNCGGVLMKESLGWRCKNCRGFISLQDGKFYEYKENDMFDFAENTKDMTAGEILSHYRNLYYAEPQTTERGIVANAINDYFAEVVQRRKVAEKANATAVKPVTRRSVLEQAIQCVCTDRNQQYGEPEDNFAVIASLWSNYAGVREFTADDVAMMMALFKVGRIMSGAAKDDSYIDACGYLACAAEIAMRENNQ